jgi:hypothetical protein
MRKPANRKAAYKRNRRWGEQRRKVLDAYKREQGCKDCGTRDGRLDFDHRPGTVKEFNLANPAKSWAKVWAEVSKCDVRCAGCHARRHNAERRKAKT